MALTAPLLNFLLQAAVRSTVCKISLHTAQPHTKPRVMGYFYKATVQTELLYDSESWTIPGRLNRQFQSFHSRATRFLTGKHIRPLEDGSWHCPPMKEVLQKAGLETVEEYIRRRKKTVWVSFGIDQCMNNA